MDTDPKAVALGKHNFAWICYCAWRSLSSSVRDKTRESINRACTLLLMARQVGALDLNKRGLVVLLLVLTVSIAAVSDIVLGNLGTSSSKGTITITIQGDSRIYSSDEASIPIKWGTVNLGENTQTVTITNNANLDLKPRLIVASSNLPSAASA